MAGFLKRFLGSKDPETLRAGVVIQPAQPGFEVGTTRRSRALSPDFDFLDEDFRFVAVDVETAHGGRHSICQIGLAMVEATGRIRTFSCLIDPCEQFDSFNTRLHGIDAETVSGAMKFDEVYAIIESFLARHLLVQHSNFDKTAFEAACDIAAIVRSEARWLDSVTIARRAWPELRGEGGGHGLANLKTALGLEFDHHDAGEDARAAAMVVLRAEEATGRSFEELAAPARSQRKYEKPITKDGNENGPLFGQTVCFTGKLSMGRDQAAQIAAAAGLTVKSSVSKNLSVLVVGDQDVSLLAGHEKSSKHRRAEELIAEGAEIRVLAETHFLKLVNG